MDSYIGQIRLFVGSYAPQYWQLCNGALRNIADYPALFALIGTTYGGNGTTNFALPNLQFRLPVGTGQLNMTGGQKYPLGQMGGTFAVTLTEAQMPAHTHALNTTSLPATTTTPSSVVLPAALPSGFTAYAKPTAGATMGSLVPMAATAVTSYGASQPHSNAMPTVVLNYIICVTGEFPSFP